MPLPEFNLALETSGRAGSVSLGRADALIESVDLPEQRRHTVDLMPTIDRLCRKHGVAPSHLAELYLSIGPGSFTGLRIGVTTAKMLARVLALNIVAVPTLDVVAQNAPKAEGHLAVCLNLKAGTVYAELYVLENGGWVRVGEPALLTMPELLARFPRPLAILLPELPPEKAVLLQTSAEAQVTILPATLARARSEAVWSLGRAAAKRGEFVDPQAVVPLYVRPPEAVELWKKLGRG